MIGLSEVHSIRKTWREMAEVVDIARELQASRDVTCKYYDVDDFSPKIELKAKRGSNDEDDMPRERRRRR